MDTNDRQAISGLFDKLSQVERQSPPRDPEAERFIADAMARQPGAPYYLAQTVVVQEHALNAAQSRVTQLETELADARRQQGGGLFAGLFGSAPLPRPTARAPQPMPQGAPGGFLAGAAQTAVGVAGGMMLASALGGMFAGDAQATELPPEDGFEDTDAGDDAGYVDDGFGDGGDW